VCVDGRIILKCALNSTGKFGLFFCGAGERWVVCCFVHVMKFCEHGDELTSIKFSKFFEYRVTADVLGRIVMSVGLL
jgi:hypothetical protein